MFGQTFSISDLPKVGILAFLEILLSADNAIVIGLFASKLSAKLRPRALFLGFLFAWIFRLLAIISLTFLFQYLWIQLLGGLYLLFIAARHFLKRTTKTQHTLSKSYFWWTLLKIELFDLAFGIDSIIAAIAFISESAQNGSYYPKIWIVYFGGMIGVFFIRYSAKLFSNLVQHFPRMELAAYLIMGWIGLKLICTALSITFPYFLIVFWAGLALLFLLGLFR